MLWKNEFHLWVSINSNQNSVVIEKKKKKVLFLEEFSVAAKKKNDPFPHPPSKPFNPNPTPTIRIKQYSVPKMS